MLEIRRPNVSSAFITGLVVPRSQTDPNDSSGSLWIERTDRVDKRNLNADCSDDPRERMSSLGGTLCAARAGGLTRTYGLSTGWAPILVDGAAVGGWGHAGRGDGWAAADH